MAPRSEYIAEQAERTTDRLHALRKALEQHPEATQAELAAALGVSERHIRRLLRSE